MPVTISHVFSNQVPDVTGTVTIFNAASPGSTATVAASAIVKPSNWNETHAVTLAPTGQEIIGAFSNGGNVSFSTNPSGFVVATAPAGGGGGVAISASNNSTSTGTVVFSNSNNVSFGMSNNAVITASASFSQSVQTQSTVAINGSTGAISFSNANNITFGVNASTITASASISVDTRKAGTGFTSTTTAGTAVVATLNTSGLSMGIPAYLTTQSAFVLSNSNNVSFGTNGSTVTATATFAQTNQTGNFYVSGNTTQLSSTAGLDLRSISFEGAGIASVGVSNGRVLVSVPSGGGAGDGVNIVQIGTTGTTGTSFSSISGTVLINGSQNITVSQNNSNQIVVVGPNLTPYLTTAALSNHSHGNPQLNLTNLSGTTASNSAGFTLSLSAAAAGGAQTGISSVALSNTTYTSGQISFRDGNGVSWASTTGQGISLTHDLQFTSNTSNITSNALNTSVSRVINIVAATNNTGGGTASLSSNVSFSNVNGATFYTSAGGAVALSYTVPAQTVDTNKAGTGFTSTTTAGTAVVATLNTSGLSMGVPAYITTYVNDLTSGRAGTGFTSTTTAGTAVVATLTTNGLSMGVPAYLTTYAAQTNQTGNFYVTANSTQLSSTAGIDLRSLSFAGAGVASVGVSNGVVVVSAPAAAGDGVNIVMAGTTGTTGTTYSASTGTIRINGGVNITVSQNNSNDIVISAAQGAIAAGTQTATSGTLVFSNSNNINFGMSGSTRITASLVEGTLSGYSPYADAEWMPFQHGQGTMILDPDVMPNMQFDRLAFPVNFSNTTNLSGSQTLSYWFGLYSRNASTLSLVTSTSSSWGITNSGTVGNYSLVSGVRLFTVPMTTTITAGQYWIAQISRTTSGAANASFSQMVISQVASNFAGLFSVAQDVSMQVTLGQGYYSASTSSVPSSIGFSQIVGTNSGGMRAPVIYFASSTV